MAVGATGKWKEGELKRKNFFFPYYVHMAVSQRLPVSRVVVVVVVVVVVIYFYHQHKTE